MTSDGEVEVALETLDINRILELLPHRYPFLLVDRVIDINGESRCTGIKNVTINEPFFVGHFPAKPVMPGVLILEAMAQTAGIMALHAQGISAASGLVYFLSIDKARFRKPVSPGDVMHLKITTLQKKRNIWRFSAVAEVNGKKHAEAELSALLGSS